MTSSFIVQWVGVTSCVNMAYEEKPHVWLISWLGLKKNNIKGAGQEVLVSTTV